MRGTLELARRHRRAGSTGRARIRERRIGRRRRWAIGGLVGAAALAAVLVPALGADATTPAQLRVALRAPQLSAPSGGATQPSFAPGAGRIYAGVTPPGLGSSLRSFLELSGRRHVAIVDRYTTPNGDFGWILDELARVSAIGMVSWNFPGDGSLASIAAGADDAYVRREAAEAKAYGAPLLIRLDWEFNGTWYPWSATTSSGRRLDGNSPSDFVAAWRHVVGLFAGDPDVSFVWCPTLFEPRGSPYAPSAWYPGDRFVGWIGLDAYPGSASWSWMQEAPAGLDAEYAFALARHKPLMIAEWALSEPGTGDDPLLLGRFLAWMTGRPDVQAELWFDYDNKPSGGADYQLSAFPKAAAALRRALRSPAFVTRSGRAVARRPCSVAHC